jgi:hypothetical protein
LRRLARFDSVGYAPFEAKPQRAGASDCDLVHDTYPSPIMPAKKVVVEAELPEGERPPSPIGILSYELPRSTSK